MKNVPYQTLEHPDVEAKTTRISIAQGIFVLGCSSAGGNWITAWQILEAAHKRSGSTNKTKDEVI